MKVICERAALLDAVNLVGGVVVARTPTPVLRCVRLTAGNDLLTMTTTDLEIGIRLAVEQVQVEEDGEALIPADKLTQIVRACDDPTLKIETEDHTCHIEGTDSHFKVFGYDPGEFPDMRGLDEGSPMCEIEAGTLQTLVQRTLFAAAAEHSRYAINGVLFDREGKKLRLVATDGRRLAVARGECRAEGDAKCIVPTKALNLLVKLMDDPETIVRMSVEDNRAGFAIGDGPNAAVLTSNLVEGSFPPFEDVIPKDQDKKINFDVDALASAVRRAALLTNEESKGVRMSFADNQLTLTSRAPEMGEAEIQVDIGDYNGEPLEIGFNPGFLIDALKVVDSGSVMVELKAPNKPGVLKLGNDFTYVVMPVNLQ